MFAIFDSVNNGTEAGEEVDEECEVESDQNGANETGQHNHQFLFEINAESSQENTCSDLNGVNLPLIRKHQREWL